MKDVFFLEINRRFRLAVASALVPVVCSAICLLLCRIIGISELIARLPDVLTVTLGIRASCECAELCLISSIALLAGSVIGIVNGGCCIAPDIESGAIEYMYSKPVSRIQIFLIKLLCCLGIIAIYFLFTCIASGMAIAFGSEVPSETNTFIFVLKLAGCSVPVLLFFTAFPLFFSSVSRNTITVLYIAALFLLLIAFLGCASHFYSSMSFFKVMPLIAFSPFTLMSEGISLILLCTYIGLSCTLIIFSGFVFDRRDLV